MRTRREEEKLERSDAIAGIRRQMAALGVPLDHLTDEEIEEGVIGLARATAKFGASYRDVADAVATLARAGLARPLR